MDDHQDGHDVVEADVYGEPKGHEAENPAGDKALPASPEFVVSWCQVKAKSFYFFQILFGGVTYVLQVGQRLRRSPEAVVAIPNEDQDKTEEPEAQIEEQIRSSSILYLFGGF